MSRTVTPGSVDVLPGQDTLLACWNTLARLSKSARLIRSSTAPAAVFPAWAPLNNAILLDPDDSEGRTIAARDLARVYADAGVDAWALWVPSHTADLDAPDVVREVGVLKRDTTTLVMQATLSPHLRRHDRAVPTSIATATRAAGDEAVPAADLGEPDGLPGLSAWVIMDGQVTVAGAWSFLHGTDCGIYTVGTVPEFRRRGFARSLAEHALADARRQGAQTATLQSTRMAQQLYESLGFQAAGRYEEWISSGGQ